MDDQARRSSSTLLNELWIRSFSYLDEKDLFRLGNVSRKFLSASSADSLWGPLCRRRWEGKQNVRRFYYRRRDEASSSTAEARMIAGGAGCDNDRRREASVDSESKVEGGCDDNTIGIDHGRVTYCVDLIRQFERVPDVPALNMGTLTHEPTSWKESYVMAEMDSRRQAMTREELVHFKWKLVYDGKESRLGLRQFDANGMYWSPYMGMCEWILRGQYLMFAGMSLLVERDEESWGWIIGGGPIRQRTVYHSVEAEERNAEPAACVGCDQHQNELR